MDLTDNQAYVLDNIERVESIKRKPSAASVLRRYHLDGWDCSDHVKWLIVEARIVRLPGGRIERAQADIKADLSLPMQAPPGPGEN